MLSAASPATLDNCQQLFIRTEFSRSASGWRSINAVVGAPVALGLGGMTLVKFVCLRVREKVEMIALVTSTAGAAKRVPFTGELVIQSATGFSALALAGVGIVEFIMGGE